LQAREIAQLDVNSQAILDHINLLDRQNADDSRFAALQSGHNLEAGSLLNPEVSSQRLPDDYINAVTQPLLVSYDSFLSAEVVLQEFLGEQSPSPELEINISTSHNGLGTVNTFGQHAGATTLRSFDSLPQSGSGFKRKRSSSPLNSGEHRSKRQDDRGSTDEDTADWAEEYENSGGGTMPLAQLGDTGIDFEAGRSCVSCYSKVQPFDIQT
jgi:hypothetical protein